MKKKLAALFFALSLTLAISANADPPEIDSGGDLPAPYGGTPTPEPATLILMGTGVAGLVVSRRKKKA